MKRYLPSTIVGAGAMAMAAGQLTEAPIRILGGLIIVLGVLAMLADHLNTRLDHIEDHENTVAGQLEWTRDRLEAEQLIRQARGTPAPRAKPTVPDRARHRAPRSPRKVRHLTVYDGLKGLALMPAALVGWAVSRAREHVVATSTAAAMAVTLPIAGIVEHRAPLPESGTPATAEPDRGVPPSERGDAEQREPEAARPEPEQQVSDEVSLPKPAPTPTGDPEGEAEPEIVVGPIAGPTPAPEPTVAQDLAAEVTAIPTPEPVDVPDVDVEAKAKDICVVIEVPLTGLGACIREQINLSVDQQR